MRVSLCYWREGKADKRNYTRQDNISIFAKETYAQMQQHKMNSYSVKKGLNKFPFLKSGVYEELFINISTPALLKKPLCIPHHWSKRTQAKYLQIEMEN